MGSGPQLGLGERERYAGQLALAGWGEAAQLALRRASTLVVGVGALGSPVATYLVAAGVGRVGLVDDGRVQLADVSRQALQYTPDLEALAVESAAFKLRYLSPDSLIETYPARLDDANAAALVAGHDVVLECSNDASTRGAVNAACCDARVPLVVGAIDGWSGILMAIAPGASACWECALHSSPDAPLGGAGLGALAGVVGSLQALAALALLAGVGRTPAGGLVRVDGARLTVTRDEVPRRPGCPACAGATL